jgi:hypothetical protein
MYYQAAPYSSFSFPASPSSLTALPNNIGLLAGWGFLPTPVAPTVTNSTGASNIAATAARLNGNLTNNGNENPTVTIYWGPSDGVTTPANWAHHSDLGILPAGTFYSDISALTASTPYYYRCYASNSGGNSWAASSATFTTLPPPPPPVAPTVTNSTGASNIADTTARLNGELTNNGNENPTVRIYWGPSDGVTTPGNWAHYIDLGTKSVGTFYSDISTSAGTTYYYRCYASNSGGTSWAASSASFTTASTPVKLIGVDASATSTTTYPGNYFFLYRFQAVASGNITTFKFDASASGNVKVAIYSDSSGAPGSLLNAVNTSTPVTAGWNSITIPSTAVVSGTYYWLSYSSDATIGYYQSGTGTLYYQSATYSSFSFPASPSGLSTLTGSVGLLAGWGFAVLPTPPPTPVVVSPGSSITFKWNASTGATKYYLQVNTSADFTGTNIFNAEVGNVTSQEVTGFSLGTTYYWRIKAGNTGGWSDWTALRSFVTN